MDDDKNESEEEADQKDTEAQGFRGHGVAEDASRSAARESEEGEDDTEGHRYTRH